MRVQKLIGFTILAILLVISLLVISAPAEPVWPSNLKARTDRVLAATRSNPIHLVRDRHSQRNALDRRTADTTARAVNRTARRIDGASRIRQVAKP